MKKLLILVLSLTFIWGCGSESDNEKSISNEKGSLDNQIDCGKNAISNNPVDFELDCSNRKIFRVLESDSDKELDKFFVFKCNEVENFKSAQLYTSDENVRTNLLISHKKYIIVNNHIYCDGADECLDACEAYNILKKTTNINTELETVRISIESH